MIEDKLTRRVSKLFRPIANLLAPGRGNWMGATRANLVLHTDRAEDLDPLSVYLRQGFGRLQKISWVQVDRAEHRVSVGFAPYAYTLAELQSVVDQAEHQVRVHSDALPPAPNEAEAVRLALEVLADTGGFLLGNALKITPFGASSLAGGAATVLSILRSSHRLRRGFDNRFGAERTELALASSIALGLGLAQRPVAALVGMVSKGADLRELQSRRQLWVQRIAELKSYPTPDEGIEPRVEARPLDLPSGPIEEYAERGWLVSLGSFAVSLLTTRSVQRSTAALFAGMPKPARLGRDAFASWLGHHLARRGVLVQNPGVLRRLDRIDCVVLDGELVIRDRFEFTGVVATALSDAEAEALAKELFDPDHPLQVRQSGRWALGPPRLLAASFDPGIADSVEALGQRGDLVLGLRREGTIRAVVGVRLVHRTGVEELIAAAQSAGMRVVLASDDETTAYGLPADDTFPAGPKLWDGIRRLQREGLAVALVASGRCSALAAADCSIGMTRAMEPVPWGADLICGDDLSDVRFLIGACSVAREQAKQSVNITLGAASVSAVMTAGGLLSMPLRRVVTVMNTATVFSMFNGIRQASRVAKRAIPAPRDRTPWHALDTLGILHRLGSTELGLTRTDVIHRQGPRSRQRYAAWELVDRVSEELFNPLTPLLAAGAGLSAVAGSMADAAMVGGVVVLNAMIGGTQRFRTDRAIRSLAESAGRRATVRRNGVSVRVLAEELVVGDIVLLNAGEVVPADCRIITAESLEVDASSLTGESLPVPKRAEPSFEAAAADRSSMLYEGTSIAAGRALVVVVAVGMETEASRGAHAARRSATKSGVEERMRALIDITAPLALVAGVGLVGSGLLRGRRLEELIGSGLSLAVASVPEGLPLLATAAQLAAAQRLSARGALVRNVKSIEALGRVNTLCVDKTGTLTQGRITLDVISDGEHEEPTESADANHRAILQAALRASPETGLDSRNADPTDLALFEGVRKVAVTSASTPQEWTRTAELPFEPGRAYHASLGTAAGRARITAKGAPEVILAMCTRQRRAGSGEAGLSDEQRTRLGRRASEMAGRGLRVLAVAEGSLGEHREEDLGRPRELTFLGFVGFRDPVRETAATAVDRLRKAGVRTVMITGDHLNTATCIAEEVGIGGGEPALSGVDLMTLSDDELDRRVRDVTVFARVSPAQKVRVVRALQRAGRTVAMVGDGANDAPAIRLADVGIALGRFSTSAARSAADVIITDERIETLVDAIIEGRAMWASVRDAIAILIGGNLGEIGFTLAAGLLDGYPPLSARQLLLVNLLTDVAPALAIALRPPTEEALEALAEEGPDASLGQPLNREIAGRAVVTALGAGSAWAVARVLGNRERASTVGLLALVGTQLGQTARSGGWSLPVIATSVTSSAVLAAIVQTPGVSHFFGCRPLGPLGWSAAIAASILATTRGATLPDDLAQWAERLGVLGKPIADAARTLRPALERWPELVEAAEAEL